MWHAIKSSYLNMYIYIYMHVKMHMKNLNVYIHLGLYEDSCDEFQ